ncbi:MAG: MFS transporter [Haliea sp.]|uniref:MFS transporter n=1 Tax=Haliea sp. TaxID=1932666 RepID=UPI0032ED6477
MPILFGVVLLDLIGFGIVIPILPFLSPQLGADKVDIALIIVSYAACAGISGPFWGRLSDRLGRKPVIMLCLGGAAVSYVMLALASQLWMIFAARAFAGIMAGNLGVASAMMSDITTHEGRARGMGLIGAAFGLGLVLGPLLGGLLAGDSGSFTLPCLVAGCMSLLAIFAAALFLPESVTPERRAANLRQHRDGTRPATLRMLRQTGSRLLVLQYVLHAAAISSITYLVPLWLGDLLGWGARQVGIVFGIQGAIMVLLQGGLLGPLVQLTGEWRLLRICISCLMLGLCLAVFAGSMPWMLAAIYLAMSGATLCMPLLNTITSQRTAQHLRGQMLGTTSSAASWGRVIGPLLAGANLTLFGYAGAWLGCIVLVLFYLAWALGAPPSRHPAAAPTAAEP